MKCPSCAAENAPGAKYCISCGAKLGEVNCPVCGATNPGEAKYCQECGQELGKINQERDSHVGVPPTDVPPPQTAKTKKSKAWILGVIGIVLLICLIMYASREGYKISLPSKDFWEHTPTQTEKPTYTPKPKKTATPSGLLFYDDFSDPDISWKEIFEDNYSTSFYNSGFLFSIFGADMTLWKYWQDEVTNGRGEVDVKVLPDSETSLFGIICNINDKDFYALEVTSAGLYAIDRHTASGWIALYPWEFSDQINQGASQNHIAADCSGGKLRLYVNDSLLAEVEDDELTSGKLGLIAGTWGSENTDILFDNFYVYGSSYGSPVNDAPTSNNEPPPSNGSGLMVTVSKDTNCRAGPGMDYELLGYLEVGDEAEVVGKDIDGNYWVINTPGRSGTCWLWNAYAKVEGDTSGLRIYSPPPLPTSTPTKKPKVINIKEIYIKNNSSQYNIDTTWVKDVGIGCGTLIKPGETGVYKNWSNVTPGTYQIVITWRLNTDLWDETYTITIEYDGQEFGFKPKNPP